MPFLTLAASVGVSMTAMTVMLGWWGGVAFIIPLDCVSLISYAYGYYKFGDFAKVGILPTVIAFIYSSTISPLIAGALGLM